MNITRERSSSNVQLPTRARPSLSDYPLPARNRFKRQCAIALFFLSSFLHGGLNAQSGDPVPVRVIDIDSVAIESVLLYLKNSSEQWITNANGLSRIRMSKDDTLVCQHLSFIDREMSWDELVRNRFYIVLESKPFHLDELVLVGRTNERKEDLLHEVASIHRQQLVEWQPTSTADALEKSGDVFIQRSQLGGGSPILRGFEANRILLVVDGVRMNNLIYRSGHLQNSITVGPIGLEQVEIIYGPGSLLYGSDALGGVIHFRSRTPQWKREDRNSWTGEAFLRYGTANQEKTAGTSLEWRNERWASRTSFSYSNIGDLRMGEYRPAGLEEHGKRNFYVDRIDGVDTLLENTDPNIQLGSAYRQWDIFHKTRFQGSATDLLELNVQYSGSSDIPRYDQLNDPTRPDTMPRFAEWNYGPQNRLLAALEWHNWKETFLFDRMDMVLSTQRIEESRITRFFGSDNRHTEAEKVNVYALSVDLEKQLDPSREMILKYGVEGILNELTSEAYRMSLSTGQRFEDIFTRYPSERAGTTQLGVYATFATKATHSDLRFESGLRYSYIGTRAEYAESVEILWPQSYLEGLSSHNQALTGSAAVQLPYTKFLRQRFSIGTAFRAPNIDDMAKIRTKGPEAQIPNFNLKPENTWQAESTLEATIERSRTRLRAAATVFYTRLRNAIIQAPFSLPDGNNTLFIGGMPFSTFSNINAENAYITGAGLALEGKGRNWGANLRIQYTYGRTELEDREQPLAHIPPVYGMLSFWYEVPIFKWRITIPAHGAKKLRDYAPDSSDNLEYATPDGTPAWFTINVYTEVTISDNLSAYLSVENILDRYYRPFSSGISAPGRHLSVTLMGKF